MNKIYREIQAERKRQDETWGEQNHIPIEWIGILTEEVGEAAKEAVDFHFGDNPYTREKYIERFRIKLIQVAAVAVQMIECLDRNNTYRYYERVK